MKDGNVTFSAIAIESEIVCFREFPLLVFVNFNTL